MTFSLATAINVSDIPKIFRNTSRLYLLTALEPNNIDKWDRLKSREGEIWRAASDELFQAAKRLESMIGDGIVKRPRMVQKPLQPRLRMKRI